MTGLCREKGEESASVSLSVTRTFVAELPLNCYGQDFSLLEVFSFGITCKSSGLQFVSLD